MTKNFTLKKSLTVGIIIIFICSSFVSSISGYSEKSNQLEMDGDATYESPEDVVVACSTFGLPGKPIHERSIPLNDAEVLYEKIQELQHEVARDPFSDNVHHIQREIITIAKEHTLLPKGVSTDEILSRLNPIKRTNQPQLPFPRAPGRASETFCNYISTGSGSALPIIILPRLIPILLTPIPRLFVRWSTYEGWTSCGGMRSGKGFIATGAQRGIALGFWGIGFSIFIPPVMAYGLFGYALYASVNAEDISYWPPNYPPEVTMLNPANGAENVPISTSELGFHISDINKALMNYSVTTTPDVGSGSGSNKPDGTYSIPISGLEGTEEYTWHIQVDDGVNEVDVYSSFTTEECAPAVLDPNPPDGSKIVPITLSKLNFTLIDYQADLMDYTVETSPDIGSGSGTGVGEGTYDVVVSNLDYYSDYTWYVNVTDGTYWKHKELSFRTLPEGVYIINPSDDTKLAHDGPNNNYGDSEKLWMRNDYGAGGSSGWGWDGLIKFDLSSIPKNVTIYYAYVKLYLYGRGDHNPTGRPLNMYRATSDWDEETVTYNTQPSYASQPTTYTKVPPSNGVWMEWNVTSDVKNFTKGNYHNFGWLIIDENYWGKPDIPKMYFWLKEHGEYIPHIEIGTD